MKCKQCGSNNAKPRGDRIYCKDCGARPINKQGAGRETFTVNKENHTATVVGNVPRNMTEEQIIKHFKIDTKRWKIKQIEYGNSQGYRKDRKVLWDVKNGKVVDGRVRDSGKMLLVWLVSIRVLLVEKVEEIRATNEVELIKKQALVYAPKYRAIHYKRIKDGLLAEFMVPDLHLGRLVDAEETGYEASPELFVKKAESAVNMLLSKASLYPIERILFPIGNDFFNVNNTTNKTSHGTPQPEDPRWQRTYMLGKRMIVSAVETMSTIAPVDILIVKGNHDEERVWYFGDTLVSWFHANPNIKIDNRPIGRKYYSYGKVLLGFAHGYYEKNEQLAGLMPQAVPQLWARSLYREFHLGDKHHEKVMIIKTEELTNGVVVRVHRSLADTNLWEYDKGFDGSLHAAEGYLWNKECGLEVQFPANVQPLKI